MKKLILTLVTVLIFTTIFPISVFAVEDITNDYLKEEIENDEIIDSKEESDKERLSFENEEFVNKLDQENQLSEQKLESRQGLKIPEENQNAHDKEQIINGDDINKLSEEELQYIPETRRNVNFASEHLEQAEQHTYTLMKSQYPNVNSYIKNNKFKVAKIEYDYKPFFAKFPYRNGYGAVEGVVAHETANDRSTITSEIAYMSRNHKNAFVHAFVDHNRIIEIHPTDYGAWGAGRYANERFVHVELVRVHTFDKFARSINNYSYYIAKVLYDYGLGVSSAEKTGQGTLWSHYAVTKHLGATTHVDPHGYFARYGYNWDEFVRLVTEKYNEFVTRKEPNTSKLGKLKSRNAYIYENPTNLNKRIVSGDEHFNKVFYIKAQAKLKGKTYFLISDAPSSKTGTIGWVENKDIVTHSHKHVDNVKKSFYLKGKGAAYNRPWGGSKNIEYTSQDLAKLKYKPFHVNLTQTVGNNIWYRGQIEGKGKNLWIHSSHVTRKEESNTSRLGKIKNENVKIYKDVVNPSSSFAAGTTHTGKTYFIKKQMKFDDQIFYLISSEPSSQRGVIGWVNAKDIESHRHKGVDGKTKVFYLKGKGVAYNRAWGGNQNLVFTSQDLEKYKYKEFVVNLTEQVGKNIWYRGKIEGEGSNIWIHSSHVTAKEESTTSRLGKINNADVKIYKDVTNPSSSFTSGSTYTGKTYFIKKQMKFDDQTYYLISSEPSSQKGVIGWVNAKDIESHSHKGVDSKTKVFYLKGKGAAYNRAWGGSQNLVYSSLDLADFKYKEFVVNLTEKVGNNTWYRGKIEGNGSNIWIHSSHVTRKEESNTSRLGKIISAHVKIYKDVTDTGSSFTAGPTHTGITYFIKKQMRFDDRTFYLISSEPSSQKGVIGWVDAKDIESHSHKGVDSKTKVFYLKGKGAAYNRAWGGSQNLVFTSQDLAKHINKEFIVNLTEQVGNNIWYRGQIEGKGPNIWIHSSHLTNR